MSAALTLAPGSVWRRWAAVQLEQLVARDGRASLALGVRDKAVVAFDAGTVHLQHTGGPHFRFVVPGGALGVLSAEWSEWPERPLPHRRPAQWRLSVDLNIDAGSTHRRMGDALDRLRDLMAWGRQIERADPRRATPPEAPAAWRQPPDA